MSGEGQLPVFLYCIQLYISRLKPLGFSTAILNTAAGAVTPIVEKAAIALVLVLPGTALYVAIAAPIIPQLCAVPDGHHLTGSWFEPLELDGVLSTFKTRSMLKWLM